LQEGDAAAKVNRAIPPMDPDVRRLVNELAEKLGASVDLQHGARGKGKLVIGFNSLDELEGILAHIK
jgi:ParB family chromosome partitioning protein